MEKLISQKDIDELLEHISDEELIDFAKSYLRTNPEMYSALKDKYMLCSEHDSESFCYKKEVDACYRFILKTPQWEYRRRYEPDYLDWEKVGNSLLRVIKRAEKCIANGDPDTAINTALYILKSNDRKFEEEYLHEREDWNPKDMHLEECISLIESAFNSPLISKQRKLFVCDELENSYDSYIFEYVDYSCVQELITEVRESLLTDDEQLDIIKRKLQNESSEWGKEEYALEIWYFLKEKGRVDEAIAFFQEHKRKIGFVRNM